MRYNTLCTTRGRVQSIPSHPWMNDLQPRHSAVHVRGGHDVVAGDIFEWGASTQCHGQLELVAQHLQNLPDSGLALRSQREQHGPSDLRNKFETHIFYLSTRMFFWGDSFTNGVYDEARESSLWSVTQVAWGCQSLLTNTPDAPKARALKTSVPRRTPPSRNTGIRPCAALTTWVSNKLGLVIVSKP